jgi:hypothetical protein
VNKGIDLYESETLNVDNETNTNISYSFINDAYISREGYQKQNG